MGQECVHRTRVCCEKPCLRIKDDVKENRIEDERNTSTRVNEKLQRAKKKRHERKKRKSTHSMDEENRPPSESHVESLDID